MSVAASASPSAVAVSWIPPSTSTEARVERARATTATLSAKRSRETVAFNTSRVTVSESIII